MPMTRTVEESADRFEIEALSGEFTDAIMTRDYDPLRVAVHR
jgi:hypothetical protein